MMQVYKKKERSRNNKQVSAHSLLFSCVLEIDDAAEGQKCFSVETQERLPQHSFFQLIGDLLGVE